MGKARWRHAAWLHVQLNLHVRRRCGATDEDVCSQIAFVPAGRTAVCAAGELGCLCLHAR